MAIWLGLDIGTNSVGSAWVDTDARTIVLGVSVFPAGVEEREDKRGDPKNKSRRGARSQRRSIARRAQRKRLLRAFLVKVGLLPAEQPQLQAIFSPATKEEAERWDPWHLRREGLHRKLSPHEFGRVLVHLNQRRGALGIEVDPEDPEEGKVKKAIECLHEQISGRTFGQFMADLRDERRSPLPGHSDTYVQRAVRNRRGAFEFHATRAMIREEFRRLWRTQKSFGGELARLLTDELLLQLDDPDGVAGRAEERRTWRSQGLLFGQRRTYWNTGSLGRCDLEPTDRCCPLVDRHAQEFRVLETLNNLRIEERGKLPRCLNEEERTKVLGALRCQKTATVSTLRRALGIDKGERKAFFTLNVERDPQRDINTDWFYRQIVHGVFTEKGWLQLSEGQRESVNRAILKFDVKHEEEAAELRRGAAAWWGLSAEATEALLEACKTRPALDRRVKLSRRAIQNLLPYLRRGLSVSEARKHFSEDIDSPATAEQRRRYSLKASALNRADRHFRAKHPNLLPPAPELSNPVVRKAIHEVRRHLNAYLQRFGRRPDRVVIEMARSARLPGSKCNQILARNRAREALRKTILDEFELTNLTPHQQAKAIERVLLCRQQRGVCPYSGKFIDEPVAAEGTGLEVDHIVPMSRSQDNSLSNKLLCYVGSNRDKGSQTPREWLGDGSERFRELEQRLAHLASAEKVYQYFSAADCGRKWDNLHRAVPRRDEFLNAQLTDTAYAARQVARWLRDVLFDGEPDGTRRVFATKGSYTALLRRDWGLGEDALDRAWHGGGTKTEERGAARRDKKDRSDHRHHAVDALVIAFCGPERLGQLADLAAKQEEAKAQRGHWTKGESLPPPWGNLDEFRAQATVALARLVVCHRPVKRRVIGSLHRDSAFGPVLGSEKQFTKRIHVYASRDDRLKPIHLRLPIPETDQQAEKRLFEELRRAGVLQKEARQRAKTLVQRGLFKRRLIDPPPGKSGIVRDRALRQQLRKCLKDNELDPENFTEAQIKSLAEAGKVRMASGVPVHRVVLLRTIEDPVTTPGKQWDPDAGRYVEDPDPRRLRVYESQNNHHIEIREDAKGRWHGEVVPTFQAARRVRADKQPAVDNSPRDGQRFIMSLADGEMVYMRHPKSGQMGCFVVFKLDKGAIHFLHHWDARPAKAKEGQQPREDIAVTAGDLKALAPQPSGILCKIHVDPLGSVHSIDESRSADSAQHPNSEGHSPHD